MKAKGIKEPRDKGAWLARFRVYAELTISANAALTVPGNAAFTVRDNAALTLSHGSRGTNTLVHEFIRWRRIIFPARDEASRLPAELEQVRHEGNLMLAFEIFGAVFTVLFLAALVGGNSTVPGR